MRYLSDDFCLLESGETPQTHCLYNTGKLHRDHLKQFPSLADKTVDPYSDQFEKKVIFVHQHYPERVAVSLPLRAILLPCVTDSPGHSVSPISPGEALRGLAPSTLFQLTTRSSQHFNRMAKLVRQLPCYSLALGRDLNSIPALVKRTLENL